MRYQKLFWPRLAIITFIAGLFSISALVSGADFPTREELRARFPTKGEIIARIMQQLENTYSIDPKLTGRTLTAVIKDFSLDDEETYAIVEEMEKFWIITLPVRWDTLHGYYGTHVGPSHKVELVRKELVSLTREQGIIFYFTVPPPRVP